MAVSDRLPAAYILVAHGSRDPRARVALAQLAACVRDRAIVCETAARRPINREHRATATLERHSIVLTAVLEMGAVPLHQAILQQLPAIRVAGLHRVRILPLFLLPGVHVRSDLPAEVARAQQLVGGEFELELGAYLGSHAGLVPLLADRFAALADRINADAERASQPIGRILLAHGSHQSEGNGTIATTAARLGATAAFWSVPPHLGECIRTLGAAGYRHLAIVPYVLFPGRIIDAIATEIERLCGDRPDLTVHFGSPLGTVPALADTIVEWFQR
ncbi:hypothetical protein KR51_00021260 [Rubidibacter lacunae KORDI 51-2]|uniref:Sirohydrochlorin cobaltochelatase n=1 Tax=Rubidibacter lacunae KORDI 51-2 TaxID=582515 RepID=U5D9Q9_9CHRO|nr:CbiX/SirB N-terminal domain-containing protein [Rubidibacter lacunae]ERN41323.1 hypothetical protein KR51_00021260 [Rubidibacter lacunae KORDI 51-2]